MTILWEDVFALGCRRQSGLASDQSPPLPPREQRKNLGERSFYREPVFGAECVDLAVLDEVVGPADANHGHRHAHVIERLDYGRTKAAHLDVILKRNEDRDATGIQLQRFAIERFHKARIDDGGGEAFALETHA